MATLSRRERRALATLLVLGIAGHLLRMAARVHNAPDAMVQILDPKTDGNPLAHLDSIRRIARPLGATERIDVNHATAVELARLPKVGPSLAKRIVADRETAGPFRSLETLDRVPGIGPRLLRALTPHLSFGSIPAETDMHQVTGRVDLNYATVEDLVALPGIGLARARAIIAFRDSVGPFRQVADLDRVPGIPSSLVRRLAPRLLAR